MSRTGLGFTVWFAMFVINAGQWWAASQSKEYSSQDATVCYRVAIGNWVAIIRQPTRGPLPARAA